MPATARWILAAAAALLLIATALGAWASHGLPASIGAAEQRTVELAIQYQFFASLGLLGIALFVDRYPASVTLKLAALGLGLGAVLFCGGIYATTFGAPEALGRVTPAGGIAMMAGWALLAAAAWRLRTAPGPHGPRQR